MCYNVKELYGAYKRKFLEEGCDFFLQDYEQKKGLIHNG